MSHNRVRAEFNGLFGDLLCLSHSDTCKAEDGSTVRLEAGMELTAFAEDADEHGQRDDLLASGTVELFAELARLQRFTLGASD
ncbi:MAG TPA: hypothetical protein VFK13_13110 [Gemmatimonadaceae bacterium]|nr:hypothetical protein [Gemmatimonadaceae bacterium]